jgi:release factor glutamine methyltransferase
MSVVVETELVAFGPLTVAFDGRVIRPRPWTVLQSEWAAALLEQLGPGDVLEICAGAGHIGLLGTAASDRRLVQVDADEVACGYARRNADHAGRAGLVEVRHGLMDDVLGRDERFALVIADPPWVASAEVGHHPEDPLTAIDGGSDGLDLVRTCLRLMGAHLLPGGAGLLQVGPGQVAAVEQHVTATPALGLEVVEHRLAEDGAVVRLAALAR